ncbi:MAG TPA: hypothetical protein VGI80_05995, partial [Pyrinomonadaceae bacterium]
MPRSISVIAVLFLTACCLLPAAFGQSTGGIKGKVRNMNGEGVTGATVTARIGERDAGRTQSGKGGDF